MGFCGRAALHEFQISRHNGLKSYISCFILRQSDRWIMAWYIPGKHCLPYPKSRNTCQCMFTWKQNTSLKTRGSIIRNMHNNWAYVLTDTLQNKVEAGIATKGWYLHIKAHDFRIERPTMLYRCQQIFGQTIHLHTTSYF